MNLELGEKIRKVREVKGLTQDYIADQLHISQNAYGKIERGETKVDIDRLKEIADILGTDVSTLLNDKMVITISNFTTHDNSSGVAINDGPKNENLEKLYQDNLAMMQQMMNLIQTILSDKK